MLFVARYMPRCARVQYPAHGRVIAIRYFRRAPCCQSNGALLVAALISTAVVAEARLIPLLLPTLILHMSTFAAVETRAVFVEGLLVGVSALAGTVATVLAKAFLGLGSQRRLTGALWGCYCLLHME